MTICAMTAYKIIIITTIIKKANTSGNSYLLKADFVTFLDFFAIYKLMHTYKYVVKRDF